MAIAIGLLKTLLELTRSRKSGALSIQGGGTRARVFVEEGTIVYADEGTIGETLGRILVREKVILDAQYNAALERLEVLHKKGEKAKLGEILIKLGFLTPVQLDAALSAQVRQKVIRAIGWGVSTFRFFECHGGALDIAARFATPLEPLVLAALRLAPEEHVEELLDLALTRYPELRGDGTPTGGKIRTETLRRIEAFELQPVEHDLAVSLDGSRTSADILASTSQIDPTIVLTALLLTDCLDLHGVARAAMARAPAPVPALEKLRPHRRVSPYAGMKAVRPIAIAKRKPSSVRPPAPSDLQTTKSVAARLKQASDARKTLPPPPAPPEKITLPPPAAIETTGALASLAGEAAPSTPMAPVNRILAEKAFQAGKAFVRANNMKDATVELARAAALFPAIEYELWATWTAMRADKEGDAKHVAVVKALAEKAIEQDPSLGFAYFVLGHLALRSRDAARAKELFAKARALDPASTSEAKDVRLTAAAPAKEEEAPQAAKAPEPEPPPPARVQAPETLAAGEEQAPVTRPSVTEATAADVPAPISARTARPTARRNMIIGVGAAAVLATVVAIVATRKNDEGTKPRATPATSSPVASSTTTATATPPPAADPNSISFDDDDAGAPHGDAAVEASSAPDTKSGSRTFPADASGK